MTEEHNDDLSVGASPLDEKKEDFIDEDLLEDLPITSELLDDEDEEVDLED